MSNKTIQTDLDFKGKSKIIRPVLATSALQNEGELGWDATAHRPKVRTNLGEKRILLEGDVGSGIAYSNILYVSPVGTDNTAAKGQLDKPFKTLTAAKNASSAGDLIYVFPGLYDEFNLLKHNVNWYFMDGAVVEPTGANSTQSVFNDAAGACTSRILGRGQFISYGLQGNDACTIAVLSNNTNLFVEARLVAGFHTWACICNVHLRGVEFAFQTAPQSGATVLFENCFFNNSSNAAPTSHSHALNVTYMNCRFKRLSSLRPGFSDDFTGLTSCLQVGHSDSSTNVQAAEFHVQVLNCLFDSDTQSCINTFNYKTPVKNSLTVANSFFYNRSATGKLIVPLHFQGITTDSIKYNLIGNVSNVAVADNHPITNSIPGPGIFVNPEFRIRI